MRWLPLFLLLLPTTVWGELTVELQGKTVELGQLTSEAKTQVPTLEGLEQNGEQLIFRRSSGDFSPAERTKLQTVFLSHDATLQAKVEEQRRDGLSDKLTILGFTKDEIDLLVNP